MHRLRPNAALLAVIACALLTAAGCDDGGAAPDAQTDAGATSTGAADTQTTPQTSTALVHGAEGRIIHIIDGDTVLVAIGTPEAKHHTVRMTGINAPECNKGQKQHTAEAGFRYTCISDDEFYGLAAAEGLKAAILGQTVTITCESASAGQPCPKDPFDRFLAYFTLEDGDDAATLAARRGYAFSFTTFPSSKRAAICAAEYDARDHDRGLWSAGSVSQIIDRMSEDTKRWYNRYHDDDCDKALGK